MKQIEWTRMGGNTHRVTTSEVPGVEMDIYPPPTSLAFIEVFRAEKCSPFSCAHPCLGLGYCVGLLISQVTGIPPVDGRSM